MNESVRQKLLELQHELESRVSRVDEALSQTHSADSAEQVTERENDDVLQSLKAEAHHELILIRKSLRRLDEGSYGSCEHCGVSINPQRLEVMPFATRCVSCADLPS